MSDPDPAGGPASAPDAASQLYRGLSGQAYHHGKRGIPVPALPWIYRLRAEKLQPWVAPTDTVVELGVGSGWNLATLPCARKIGCDAVDDPEIRQRLAQLGIEFVERLDDLDHVMADVLFCHHTLEHLLDPVRALMGFRRVLRPRGLLVLHVPWEIERRYARFDRLEPNHHLFGWNAQSLGNLVTVLGWHIRSVKVQPYGYDRFTASLALRFRLGEPGFRALRWLCLRLRPLREVELVASPGPPHAPSPAPAPAPD